MNALKHMEFIFGVVVVAGCVAAALPDHNSGAQPQPGVAAAGMPVVVVKGKRLSALEKRQLSRADAGARHDAMSGT